MKWLLLLIQTLSSFSNASARRGTQPWMASHATALSHAGHPAAACSPSTYLLRFPNLKLRDSLPPLELALPDSPNSLLLAPTDSVFFFLFFSDSTECSIAGVTDTACFATTHPITLCLTTPYHSPTPSSPSEFRPTT